MASTMVVDSAIVQISKALDYDVCERMLADDVRLDRVLELAVRQAQAAYIDETAPDGNGGFTVLLPVAA